MIIVWIAAKIKDFLAMIMNAGFYSSAVIANEALAECGNLYFIHLLDNSRKDWITSSLRSS